LGGFLIYLTQTDHGALYKKKLPPPFTRTPRRRAKS
jgi:hypothetical protein